MASKISSHCHCIASYPLLPFEGNFKYNQRLFFAIPPHYLEIAIVWPLKIFFSLLCSCQNNPEETLKALYHSLKSFKFPVPELISSLCYFLICPKAAKNTVRNALDEAFQHYCAKSWSLATSFCKGFEIITKLSIYCEKCFWMKPCSLILQKLYCVRNAFITF